jgi:hypothetical protein
MAIRRIRHFKTCSKHGAKQKPFVLTEELTPVGTARSNGRTILDRPLRLTETEYNEVAEQLGDGLNTEAVAFSYPHVEMSEIRKVSISKNYEDYLRHVGNIENSDRASHDAQSESDARQFVVKLLDRRRFRARLMRVFHGFSEMTRLYRLRRTAVVGR